MCGYGVQRKTRKKNSHVAPGRVTHRCSTIVLPATHSAVTHCLAVNVPEKRNPNVTTPLLPVMIYLHAGEFRFGAANDAESGFPYFAEGAAILVTANARLSLMGFAALDALRSRDTAHGSTGNYGLQDQRAVVSLKQSR